MASIKASFILLYLWGISFFPDIRRVFQYHGTEHKSICTFESGQPLEVEYARRHPTAHARCGTSFILVVLLVSILIFAVFFPLFPGLTHSGLANNLLQVLVKVGLMLPIAAISYEIIRWGGEHRDHFLARFLLWPGLATQRLTALEPDDSQLQVALEALKAVVVREQHPQDRGESGAGVASMGPMSALIPDPDNIPASENANRNLKTESQNFTLVRPAGIIPTGRGWFIPPR